MPSILTETITIGHVKACHLPRNERCPHNSDPRFDCACKSSVPKVRKPFRVVRVDDPTVETHGLTGHLVIEIHRNGLLAIRQKGRRRVYTTTIGRVFEGVVWRQAMVDARAKKARKRK